MSTGTLLDATEQPVLWLGMAGFGPAQRASLEASLASSTGSSRWRPCAFGDADAWWVNGAKSSLLPEGTLKVAAGLPTERALKLDLSQVDRELGEQISGLAAQVTLTQKTGKAANDTSWMNDRRCISCHHVPLLLWSHRAAQVHGLAINTAKLAAWDAWTRKESLSHRNLFRLCLCKLQQHW